MIDEMRTYNAEAETELILPPHTEAAAADLSLRADPETYKADLRAMQKELGALPERLKRDGRSMMLVFEGWDAAGKGGAIRRITDALREDRVQVFPISAPSPEEKARHYLWRFWRTVPPVGHIAIYDRSWYGRVLVERVEGFASEEEWKRAYGEIRAFEETMCAGGCIIVKFWLEISPEEQLRRFEARMNTPEKRHKMTEEDWRNRAHRAAYLPALRDMLRETDTTAAPWEIIAAEDKKYARLAIMERVLLSAGLCPPSPRRFFAKSLDGTPPGAV